MGYAQMKEKVAEMKNKQKIDDFSGVVTAYEAVIKMLEKLKSVMDQEGGAPGFFIKAVVNLEKYVETTFKKQKEKKEKGEKLNQNKALAFNTLRAKVKKGMARELAPYADDMQRMKDHPEEF